MSMVLELAIKNNFENEVFKQYIDSYHIGWREGLGNKICFFIKAHLYTALDSAVN